MNSAKKVYKNLVFEGGGVKASAYAGCIQVMDERGLLNPVEHVAGTSSGSITATLLAVGAGSKGLMDTVINTNFNQFIYDPGWILMDLYRVFRYYGIHSGNGFVKDLKKNIAKYGHDPELTFGELEKKAFDEPHKFKHLSVVASNITTQQVDVFNSKNTPEMPIWKAVRCSMSIPIVFEPYKINDNYYMDGGTGWIYPIDIYDEKKPDGEDIRNPDTLGFYLEPANRMKDPNFIPQKLKINSLKSAAEAMFSFFYNVANSKHIHPGDISRTVLINDLGIKATDFSISKKCVEQLIESGRAAAKDFLK